MITIRVKADIARLTRGLDNLAQRQVPFAQARAVTEVAKRVAKAETAALPQVLDRPTPFTMRAFTVRGATKAKPTATVFAKDIQAAYLAPSEFGTLQVVAKVAVLRPVDVRLNQYGNIPRRLLSRLKAGGDCFIGRVTTKGGDEIAGVWQRLGQRQARRRGRTIELLMRFADPVALKPRLGFRERAERIVRAELPEELHRQLEIALASSR